MLIRTSACAAALALMLLVAACGGDDEPAERAGAGTSISDTATDEAGTADTATAEVSTTQEIPPATGPDTPTTSPEDQPGGAGDEEAIRTRVVLEFAAGRLSPARVQVPPFIAVELIVRSKDGSRFNISVNGPRSAGGADGTEADLELEGLRPDERYEVEENRTGAKAVVVASAEPGP